MDDQQTLARRPADAHRTLVRWLGILLLGSLSATTLPGQVDRVHQRIHFVRSGVEPSLPQSSIYSMLQDAEGFLWFGTREGIGRWDGYEMRTWRMSPFSDRALPDNIVRRMLPDRHGHIYALTAPDDVQEPHIARLVAPSYRTVETLPERGAVPFLDRDGNAWIAGRDSVYPADPAEARRRPAMRRLQLGVLPLDALVDRTGTFWVYTLSGRLERIDPTGRGSAVLDGGAPVPLANRFGRIFEDAGGTIWMTGQGLHRLVPGATTVERVASTSVALDSIGTSDILQDPDGWLWLATLDGVYRFDPALVTVERYSMRLAGGIATQNFVASLMRDRAGAIWAGTIWGLHRYDPAAKPFTFLTHDPNAPNTIGSGLVLSLLEDETGALWVGTLGGGLNRIDPRTGRLQRLQSALGSFRDALDDWIWSIADAGAGRVWIGTARGLALVDPRRQPAVKVLPLPSVAESPIAGVYALLPDGNGGVWIGRGGTLMHRSANGTLTTPPLEVSGMIHTLRADAGALWIGTTVGLLRYDTGSGDTRWFRHDARDSTTISDDLIIALQPGADGALWVGTQNGLNRLDPATGRFEQFADDPAVSQAVIQSMLETKGGALWLGTNRGLIRFDRSAPAGQRSRRYGPLSGTGNIEFNRNAAWQAQDGALHFGGDLGVTRFHPDDLVDNSFIPPVVLTSVQRAGRHGTTTAHHLDAEQGVVLTPEDVTVTFTFAALNFTNAAQNGYSWLLEGFDPQWSPPSTARTASYTNLPPGRYILRVRGSNDDGRWNAIGLAVPVEVEPAIWDTWWFRAGLFVLALLLASAATALVQRGRHRRELDALAYREALEGERARISRDMHDEVGAGITEIAMLSELAVRQAPRSLPGDGPWQRVADRARTLIGSISEIIWAITPEHDSPNRLAPYLREYTAEFLEHAGLRSELHFDLAAWRGPVHAEFRRNLFLFLKESLTNAVRHAEANTVTVTLTAIADTLTLVVRDDGRGIAEDAAATAAERGHLGLVNLQRRAEALRGILTVVGARGGGTTVTLHLAPASEGR